MRNTAPRWQRSSDKRNEFERLRRRVLPLAGREDSGVWSRKRPRRTRVETIALGPWMVILLVADRMWRESSFKGESLVRVECALRGLTVPPVRPFTPTVDCLVGRGLVTTW